MDWPECQEEYMTCTSAGHVQVVIIWPAFRKSEGKCGIPVCRTGACQPEMTCIASKVKEWVMCLCTGQVQFRFKCPVVKEMLSEIWNFCYL